MKKIVLISLYGLCLVFMLAVVIGYNVVNKDFVESEEAVLPIDYEYVHDIVEQPTQQVNSNNELTLIRPYFEKEVSIIKNYYDYKADEKTQQNAITYYEGTYMQNTGISYGSKNDFDVVAVYPGEVTEVSEDELVGNSITIKHSDNTYSVYQSIKDISVKKGDKVKQGDKIAISGTSNISKDLNNHLYFELIIDSNCVNPEEYYDKSL